MKKYVYAAVVLTLLMAIMTVAQGPAPAAGSVVLVQTLTPQVDVFLTSSLTYTLNRTPATGRGMGPMVYVNGLLMCAPYDYTLTGSTLTFTGQPTDQMDSPIIQVLYWTVAQ